MIKKIISIVMILTVSAWLVGPGVAQAITADELQVQIDALMAQLADLQAELAGLTGETPTVAGCTITSFDRNLSVGDTGTDVNCLQIVLNSSSDTQLASSGVGSSGNETSYFGPLTKGGVIKFQEKYASEVLASWGLTSGTGFVGSTTRAKLNTLLTAPAEEEEEEEEEEVPSIASGLAVGLTSDTPAAGNVPKVGNTNFTKFTLTAGSEGSVSISKIYVTRSGLSANSDVENIKIIDVATGVHKGSVGSLNVDNRAMITFLPNLVISAGTSNSYYIRAGATTGSVTGNVIVLGIASADDIVSDASEVNGLPVTGNGMEILATTIGTVQVTWDGTVSDSTPDVGDTDVIVNQFKATVGATEGVTIEQITVKKAGAADSSDTNNIELYDVTNSVSLGTASAWDSEGKASWGGLNLSVGKGKTQRFKIMLDIADGPSKTVNVDLTDGSDVMVSVKGNNYGFYITPTVTGSWTGQGGTSTAVPQTINSGALNIAKSADSPATGTVAVADDMILGAFDFDSRGEDIKITTISLTIIVTDASGSGFYADEITNLTIYDEDDNIVAGPKNAGGTADQLNSDFDFTDTFILPVGIHTYKVIGDISTNAATLDTITVYVEAPQSIITATGMTSNDTIDGSSLTPATDVTANTLTVAAGSLAATTLTQPVARNVAAGITDFVWATASLSAATSGEDVQITAVIIEDTLEISDASNAAVEADEIDNMEIWADLTSENSARGDIYETKVSNTEQPDDTAATDELQSFTLTQAITVPKGSFIKIAVVADLAAGATAGDQHIISLDQASGAVTATGADTGSAISVTPTGAGQRMTVSVSGALTVTRDSSSPQVDIVLGTEMVTLGIFRLAASNVEDLDLDSIYLSVTNGAYVDTYYFYVGGEVIQTAPSGTTPYVAIADGTVTIPANGNVKLTVKGKIQNMASLTNNTTITVNTSNNYKIDATGLASGAAVDGTNVISSYGMDTYETRPYFALNSASPSGTLIPATNDLLAIFDVTAASYEDVTFELSDSSLTVQISTVQTDTDGTDTSFTLRDKDGIALSTVTAVDDATSVQFLFGSVAFTVPAGQTKQLYVYANTTDWEDDGDTIQLWLDDGTAGNIDWSIDSDGNAYLDADKIFRGDIFAGAFVNPS